MTDNKTVLITGAAGNIGKKLRAHFGDRYALKLLDIKPQGDPSVVAMDLSIWDDRLVELLEGVDVVVHLAADPNENRSWEELIAPNLDALNNLFIAAIKARVPRVVFASSNHVMGGYADETGDGRWLTTELEHKPGTKHEWTRGRFTWTISSMDSTAYGAMKIFGERLGKCYAQSAEAVFVAVRIGWVNSAGDNRPEDLPNNAMPWFKQMWLSTPDLCQLMEQAISVPLEPKTFLVVNGMSNNKDMVWDIETAKKKLGYIPRDGI